MPDSKKIDVLVIVGATASGKTALGVGMAKKFNGEVVSADSMQIYRGMDIATAKPTADEMDFVPHHLIDFLNVDEDFSVARYVELAGECVQDIHNRGNLPIIVGGTGLYINSLVDNIEFTQCAGDEEYRELLKNRALNDGAQSLLGELSKIDPEAAAKLHPNNIGRIIRALEIYKCCGITMTEQIKRSKETPSPYVPVFLGIDYRNREILYSRINARVDKMLEAGLVKEAEEYFSLQKKTAAQAIGYKELRPYFNGDSTLQEAVESLKMQTRRYAKRQLTWFRKDKRINWIYADSLGEEEILSQASRIYISEREK